MGCGATGVEFHRCGSLRVGGFARLGEARGTGIHVRRTIRLVRFRPPGLRCLFRDESDMGSVHPLPKTMANWHVLARAYSDLDDCGSNRFRSPLTMVGETLRITQNQPIVIT